MTAAGLAPCRIRMFGRARSGGGWYCDEHEDAAPSPAGPCGKVRALEVAACKSCADRRWVALAADGRTYPIGLVPPSTWLRTTEPCPECGTP